MTTKQRIKLTVDALLLTGFAFSQNKPSVYKIEDLIKRIHNNSDTIYVVNFWATWCKPCVQELPDFEKLGLETKNTKVKVLLVSMDFKENLNDKVYPFLQKNNYKTECVLLDEIDGNSFINKVTPKWSGAIPATYITKHNKKQEEFVEKKMHYEEIKSILEKF